MPAAAQRRSKTSYNLKHTDQSQLVDLVRLVDVEHRSRSGDLRMCVSATWQVTCACWRSPGAVRSRSERSQRGCNRWGGPHDAIPVFTAFFRLILSLTMSTESTSSQEVRACAGRTLQWGGRQRHLPTICCRYSGGRGWPPPGPLC